MGKKRYSMVPGSKYLLRDGKSFLPVGTHFVPNSGPDWPWREDAEAFDTAFAQMAEAGLDTVRIDLIWAAIEPSPGHYDEKHLQVCDQIFDAAERHGLSLHPTLFVGGEVGDAYWDLPWAVGRNPHTDTELLEYQYQHAAHLANRWKDRTNLIAWDLTDEPPFWLYGGSTNDDDARNWIRLICGALSAADPGCLITIGTASQEIGHGPFRADVTAPHLDFLSVHPYPIYSPDLYPDALLSPRMTMGASFETALAAGAGKPVMLHEYGASTTQFTSEQIGRFDKLQIWSSFGYGSVGFYSWCWMDAAKSAYRRAPYVRSPHETQFGMVSGTGVARERLQAHSDMARIVEQLDLGGRASNGVQSTAAIPVPHEFVKPFDPKAFGLSDAPSGMYAPSEGVWRPDRNVQTLVKGWLNSFVLATKAGFAVDFVRERLDGEWPEAPLVLSPAPLTSTSNSLEHLRTITLAGVGELHEAGRTLYLSCSSETAIPELEDIAGVRIVDRAASRDEVVFTMVKDFGELREGEALTFRGLSSAPNHRGVLLELDGAEVLAVDEEGNAVLTRATIGRGQTVLSAYPIELGLSATADAFVDDGGAWRIYAALADVAGARPVAGVDHPELASHVLTGPQGGVLVVINHATEPHRAVVRLPGDAVDVQRVTVGDTKGWTLGSEVVLEGHDVAVFTWSNGR